MELPRASRRDGCDLCSAPQIPAKLADKILRTPKCSRCRNHGFLVPVKGHVGMCRWKRCTCEKCSLITERQKIMAAQKQLKKEAEEEEGEQQQQKQQQATAALGRPEPQLALEAPAPGPSFRVPVQPLRPLPLLPPPLPLLPPPLASAAADMERGAEGRVATYNQEQRLHSPSPGPSAFQSIRGCRGLAGPSKLEAPPAGPSPGLLPREEALGLGGGPSHPVPFNGLLQPRPSPPFQDYGLPLSINPQSAVASEYLERDPAKLYANLRPFRPYQLGYQDASPSSGIPLHQDFRHVSCNQYCEGGLMPELIGDFPPRSYSPPPPSPLSPLSPPSPILPSSFLSKLQLLPPLPPSPPSTFSVTVLSNADREPTDDQEENEAVPTMDPSQPATPEKFD
ncbi:doublesex- and mab-3-related transcription factor B1 [Suncus etruscus]|uniref:doublesex- and mab-3-related transcription factor B1 n=1 Tax=Suncus etruscus TaxID=109475 RepID=UPI00210F9A2E|nr:doublesex- and mab-3-related transcription factor B1 [Suncus etruscus]